MKIGYELMNIIVVRLSCRISAELISAGRV